MIRIREGTSERDTFELLAHTLLPDFVHGIAPSSLAAAAAAQSIRIRDDRQRAKSEDAACDKPSKRAAPAVVAARSRVERRATTAKEGTPPVFWDPSTCTTAGLSEFIRKCSGPHACMHRMTNMDVPPTIAWTSWNEPDLILYVLTPLLVFHNSTEHLVPRRGEIIRKCTAPYARLHACIDQHRCTSNDCVDGVARATSHFLSVQTPLLVF